MRSDGGQSREDDLNITVRYAGVEHNELLTAEAQAAQRSYLVACFQLLEQRAASRLNLHD